MNKLQAKEAVKKLVEKYEAEKAAGKISEYNEAETRGGFINPLFQALGWDVENRDEVGLENTLSSGRVDYSFKASGIIKYFVEAKNFKEDLEKPEYAEQAVNYAWHKGVVWAILTNFEGIKVFNGERKTKSTRESIFIGLKCTDYLAEFDKLWLLSKESVTSGLLDREAEGWGKKEKKQPVSKQILDNLLNARAKLTRNINEHPRLNEVTAEELDECVQRILDRLIFIRTCEDRNIEQPNGLMALVRDGKKSLWEGLTKTFRQFDDSYNSKLFEPHHCEKLAIDDEVIKEVIELLYHTKDNTIHYDFSAINADVLGNIYEQYLGHILKKTPQTAKLKETHQHRKEQGIYYTPTYIVDYIVKNTLGEVLRKTKLKDAQKIKVLDPACGSGSFLIRAFDEFVEYYRKNTPGELGEYYHRKIEILKNNIHGVDLDKQAVEITQMNLMLKTLQHKERLPYLKNIRVGNSLIDDASIAGDKAFNWNSEFKEIMNNGGFDVIIGNPPYINALSLTKTMGKEVKEYWKTKYYSAKGTYDIYVLFIEQSLNICKDGGYVSFITPNKYFSSPYGKALRQLIVDKYKLVKIIDLSRVKVFEDPSVYPIITVIKKENAKKKYNFSTEVLFSPNIEEKKVCVNTSDKLSLLPENIWGLILSDNVSLIEKVFSKTQLLDKISVVQATSTAAEADEFSEYVNETEKGLRIINTGTIDRYNTTWGSNRFMNKGQKLIKPYLDITQINNTRKQLYQSPKIIISKLALCIEAYLDLKGDYASINTNCIHSPKKGIALEYLAGVVNSKLISFIYAEIFSGLKMSGGYFQFQAPQLSVLPIVEADQVSQNEIIKYVNHMVMLNEKLLGCGDKITDERKRLESEIQKNDGEIDELVYKLYGLTEEEIKIVEADN